MAQKQFKIGLSNTDKQNMAQDVYERLLALTFPEYETTESYEIGDFVVYNDQLYKCIGATSGAWDSSKWQLATLNDLVTDIENAVAFVNDKANVDGNYPTMTVGVADQLSPYDDESGDDQDEPFSFQATGTGNGTQPDFSTGSIALMKEKQGNTVVVNQLFRNTQFSTDDNNGITLTINNDGSFTVSGIATAQATFLENRSQQINVIAGHSYAWIIENKPSDMIFGDANGRNITNPSASFTSILFIRFPEGADYSTSKTFKIYFIDLTQWFNGDIPADLLAHPSNFFRYYQGSLSYNEGTLVNANGRYIKCIGMNQWDEERDENKYLVNGVPTYVNGYFVSKNFIRVIPNAEYGITNVSGDGNISLYDANQNYIDKIALSQISPTSNTRRFTVPSNCCYIKFYNPSASSNISINLYYEDEPRCLTYEPYQVLTNNDTGTEVLRKAGNVKDSKAPDGTITRRIGYVDLGSLTWGVGFGGFYTSDLKNVIKKLNSNVKANIVCPKYTTVRYGYVQDKEISQIYDSEGYAYNDCIQIKDSTYNDAAAFKTAMSGVYLFYELEEPTTEQGTPYSENLVIDDFGSMDFDSDVPQGALIFYPVDYKAFVDTLYKYTDGTPSNIALKSDLPTAPQTWAESLPGYDATKTQTLKNVEGTLTWVTEGE